MSELYELKVNQIKYEMESSILFSNLTFEVKSGEILHIQGPNGVGKTTLLKLIMGLGEPEEGEIQWQGESISSILPKYHSKLIYLGHQLGLKSKLTVFENLNHFIHLSAEKPAISCEEAILAVKMESYRDTAIEMLSAGQQRRVSLSRLLSHPKILWILDEPFASLDEDGRILLEKLLQIQMANGGMVVLTSHQALNIPCKTVLLS